VAGALDFEIDIGAGGEERGHAVSVRSPGGGEATTVIRLPEAEVASLVARIPDAVIASSAMVRRSMSVEERPVRQLGSLLYEALLPAEVRGLLVAARQRAIRDDVPLRVVLRIAAPELARLPWEFLFDPNDDDYLCVSTPLIRYPQVSRPVAPLQVVAPLRILGMVARPADQQQLAVEEEKRRLHTALARLEESGRVELGWVAGQTWRDLRSAIRARGPWNILHFIGHGGFDAVAKEGTLALAGETGGTFPLRASDLAGLVERHSPLRLVLLNACDTGRASALDPFSSVAGALMRKGIPAVLAMQFSITDTAAVEFSRAFYEGIADQLPVDLSVTDARQAVRIAIPGTLEWGTPVLYLRYPDGYVFDLTNAPAISATALRPAPARAISHEGDPELDHLYTDALAAYYTEQWDEAVEVFRTILARDRGYKDAATKLEHARRQQQLAQRYAAALTASDSGDWAVAVENLKVLLEAEPGYRDAERRLERAALQRDLAELQGQARQLHDAGKWAAVVAVGEQLAALDPEATDPGGLITSARRQLAAEAQARDLDRRYRTALEQLDTGRWQQALVTFEGIQRINPYYRETPNLLTRARRELSRLPMPPDQPVPPSTIAAPKPADMYRGAPRLAAPPSTGVRARPRLAQIWATWKWTIVALGIFAVLLIGVAIAGWQYSRSGYYVGEDHGNVAIFQGSTNVFGSSKVKERPNPPIALTDLPKAEQDSVRQKIEGFDSIDKAHATVASLRQEMCRYSIGANGSQVVIFKGMDQPKCAATPQIIPSLPRLELKALPGADQNAVKQGIAISNRQEADARLAALANAAKQCQADSTSRPDCPRGSP
jgi:hypothetical protein